MKGLRARTVAAAAIAIALAGCSNVTSPFPAGSEPWEENLAPMPEPVEGDPCPEDVLSFHRTAFEGVRAVHGRACIHQPLSVVWRALRDPQTSRDPTTTHGFRVVAYDVSADVDPPPAYSYLTAVHVDDIIDLDFEQTWRHYLVEGTDEEPLLTATRWQKTFGSELLYTMEGSIVAQPLDEDPSITLIEYQYHLRAAARDDHGTIESFLTTIYGRLRQRAHDEPLVPDDCVDCAEAPANY
jgi:hypothetical protein